MKQDLRKLFEAERRRKHQLPKGHEARFEALLDREFPGERKISMYYFLGIAASVVVLIGLTLAFYSDSPEETPVKTTVVEMPVEKADTYPISLGDLSPDLKKVETYYLSSIHMELAQLEVTDPYREVVDDFMGRLAQLDEDYKNLNEELNEMGPNEQTVSAMIRNLQLRLQILLKLKEKLHQLKSSKNETVTNETV
jgi:hypothetical protein